MKTVQLTKQEKIIILALIVVSVIAWTFTVHHSRSMGSEMSMINQPLIPGAILFLFMWIVMMIAMMFPAVVPMAVIFSNVQGKRKSRDQGFIPTWVFISGYLLVWALFGVLAYLGDLLVGHLAARFPKLQEYGSVIGGSALIIAGLYQLTPLKNVCLTHCRSPLHFIMHKWREGYLGSLIMGIDHGAYCLGCCWGLMLVLFVVGVMNLVWMGILTLIIFVEKISKHGVVISKVVGGLLILLGIAMAAQHGVPLLSVILSPLVVQLTTL